MSLSLGCVPKSQGTPNTKNGKQGLIGDYVPVDAPMVPGLIVRCINEVSVPLFPCSDIINSVSEISLTARKIFVNRSKHED